MRFQSKLYFFYTIVLCITVFHLDPYTSSTDSLSEVVDGGRNESSTPRTFILPATPAVARLQEKRMAMKKDEYSIKGCMLVLNDAGYPIGNIGIIDNMEVIVSILKFQRKNMLFVSGVFDDETKERLGCGI
jgi:hypothetical protein